jgi:hypothetical protein
MNRPFTLLKAKKDADLSCPHCFCSMRIAWLSNDRKPIDGNYITECRECKRDLSIEINTVTQVRVQ